MRKQALRHPDRLALLVPALRQSLGGAGARLEDVGFELLCRIVEEQTSTLREMREEVQQLKAAYAKSIH